MKFFNAVGPSARTVRMFLAEKELTIEFHEVNILAGENRTDEHNALNPTGQLPFLQLDDNFVLSESLSICEYLDELHPEHSLLGNNAKERAETRMWCRRIDLRILEPSIQAFKATDAYEFFKDRYVLVVQGASELKALAASNLEWLDQQMQGQSYICADRFSLADLQLFCFLEHSYKQGKGLPDWPNLTPWFQRMLSRPSVELSRHPQEV